MTDPMLRLADRAEIFAEKHKFNGQALHPLVLELASALRELHADRTHFQKWANWRKEENERLRGELEKKNKALWEYGDERSWTISEVDGEAYWTWSGEFRQGTTLALAALSLTREPKEENQ